MPISAALVPTLFDIVRRNASLAHAHATVAEALRSVAIIPVNRSVLQEAESGPGADFEDNLQIACAVRARLDAIVTRDASGFTASPIRVATPSEVRSALEQTGAPEAGD
jgi:predicted nucleic acid-binding protein